MAVILSIAQNQRALALNEGDLARLIAHGIGSKILRVGLGGGGTLTTRVSVSSTVSGMMTNPAASLLM